MKNLILILVALAITSGACIHAKKHNKRFAAAADAMLARNTAKAPEYAPQDIQPILPFLQTALTEVKIVPDEPIQQSLFARLAFLAHENRVAIGVTIAAAALVAGGYYWYKNYYHKKN